MALLKRVTKPIFRNKRNGQLTINIPKDVADMFGRTVIFDVYKDKVVIKPIKEAIKESKRNEE